MPFSFYDPSILSRMGLITPSKILVILIATILSTIVIAYITKNSKNKSGIEVYFILVGFGFLMLYLAFSLIKDNIGYGYIFTLILISEALFWSSLKFMQAKDPNGSLFNYINTSLVGLVYLIFIILLLVLNSFKINENDIYIISTLLLISIFKTLFGIFLSKSEYHFIQLHIYSYIFLFMSIILSPNLLMSILFNFTGYLIALFSANELSETYEDFSKKIFTLWILIIIVGLIVSLFYIQNLTPILPLSSAIVIVAATLVKIRQNSFNEYRGILYCGIIGICFILYYVLTGTIFILSQLYEIVK